MSNVIDKKIVEMSFENDKFEKGVSTSLGTIDKLKNGLKFDKVAESFAGLTTSMKGFSLSWLLDGINGAEAGFLGLAYLGVNALGKIADAAVRAGLKLASALTIDPIMTGFNEYELKVNAIQTIMAGSGESLKTVTKYLEELNVYSDRTIYSFSDMTQNIGKFTNAGVKLDLAVKSIKGIANVAALSGANANEAARAMYNFSQALSQGSVKLIDWKSIELANMGTSGFKQELIDTALAMGLLSKGADGVTRTLKDTAVSTKNFQYTLDDAWLTSEVLTTTLAKYTDESTALGKSAIAAAQDVKTFTQMLSTLKEAAQSGWSQTWEIVVGDISEAKSFITELNNIVSSVIQSSADLRNALLLEWKDLGGRDTLIEAIRNALEALSLVIKPISEALNEIFPPVTAKQLMTLTENLKKFTEGLKLTAKGAETVKRIFKGVFALVDIVAYAFTSLAKAVFGFGSTLGPTVTTFSEFIAMIADYIVNLRNAIRNTDAFSGVFDVIKSVLAIAGSAFKKFFDFVVDGMKNFKGINLDSLTTFIDKLRTKFKLLDTIIIMVGKIINFFKLAISKLAPIVLKVASVVAESVSWFIDKISGALGKFEPGEILSMINAGLLGSIILAIKNFISQGSDVFGGISGILDSVQGSLEAWQNSLKADTLLKIAAAIGIMALSLLLLAVIDKDKLAGALLAMTTMIVEMGLSLSAFEKIASSSSISDMTKMAIGLISISAAMLIMALAVRTLGTMDSKQLVKGMLAIVTIIGVLSASSKSLSTNAPDMIKGALALIIFSFAIRSLSKAVLTLGEMDTESLTKGLVGVGILMTELALFMKSMNLGGLALSNVLGILVLAGAISILVKSVEELSKINGDDLAKALTAIGVILAELSLFVYATAGGSTLLLTAVSLGVITIAMLGLTEVMERLGALSWESVRIGLTAMAYALTIIGIAAYLLPTTMLAQAAGLVVMGLALVIIADAMKKMGSMSWEEIARGLTALAGSLLVLALALGMMTGTLGGSAALLIASVALLALAPALKTLGSMSWEEIARGMAALAATLVILGLAGLVLTPVVPTLLVLGAAMLLIGAGLALAGVGLLAFSAGLAQLAVSGVDGMKALVIVISSFMDLLPMFVATIGRTLIELVKVFIEGAPTLLKGLVTLLNILLDGLLEVLTKVVDVVVQFILKILETLAKKTPKLVQAGYDILKSFLKGVRANIGEVVTVSIDIINAYLKAIADRMPEIVDSGWNLIISWINAMKEAVDAHLPELITSVQELGLAIIKGLVKALIDGRNNAFDAIKEIAQMIIDEFKYILGIHSPSTVFADFGLNIILGLVNGLKSNVSKVVNVITELGTKMVNVLKTKYANMVSAGADLVSGFGMGIRKYIGEAVKAATQLATASLKAIKDTLGIHSPSKALTEVGKFADFGLANGITKFANVVLTSINDLGDSAISGFSSVIGRISDAVNNNMDIEPTIRPIIDISNIEKGRSQISSMFGDLGLNLSASTNKAKSISIGNDVSASIDRANTNGETKDITFIQNNNSPKALSPIDIYRNTKNLLSKTQKVVGA